MSGKIFAGQLRVFPTPRERARPTALQPVYLLADSQLLFRRDRGGAFLQELRGRLGRPQPSAAYVGASNGDHPDLYGLFAAAMEGIGITRVRMIPAAPSLADEAFLATADLILLAGGDVERGWKAMQANGVRRVVLRRHREGAVIVGVSAGAVQLGMVGWREGDAPADGTFPTFGLVPFVVDAHQEDDDWSTLRSLVQAGAGTVRGLGIPRGAGVLVHADGSVEAVRHPVAEIAFREREVACSLLFPASP
jgi:cyanophycinase-like exopeptidase